MAYGAIGSNLQATLIGTCGFPRSITKKKMEKEDPCPLITAREKRTVVLQVRLLSTPPPVLSHLSHLNISLLVLFTPRPLCAAAPYTARGPSSIIVIRPPLRFSLMPQAKPSPPEQLHLTFPAIKLAHT